MPLSDLLADQVAVRPLRNYTYVTVGEGYSGGGYKIGCALFTAVRVPETHSVTLPAGNSASSLPRVVDAPTPRLEPARVPAANVEDSTAESPDAAEGPVLENVLQCVCPGETTTLASPARLMLPESGRILERSQSDQGLTKDASVGDARNAVRSNAPS